MSLDISTTKNKEMVIIKVKGEVDLYTSPDLRAEILKAVKKKTALGIDLSEVAYMDSSGVATLVEGMQSTSKNGGTFSLVSPSNSVMKVLQLARLDSVFTICDSK